MGGVEMEFKFIDLFSGIGGFRLAFEKAGGQCVFSSEIDKNARETYYMNFKTYPSGDITKVEEKEIPDHDILCAGFPCQPFSIAGRRLGFEDTRGTLFFDVARILKAKQPKAFLLENVRGLVNHDDGNTLKSIENTLVELGYVISHKVMNAKEYGIPQNRDRWYCIGIRKNLGIKDLNFIFPEKKELSFLIDDIIEKKHMEDYKITERALFNINIHKPKFLDKSGYSRNILLAYEIRPSKCGFKNDGISPCLTAKMGTGGNNIPVIVDYNRKLTERECLRIMGFPESFKIKPNNQETYKQIGNSVVVPIIEELAKGIKKIII
jgi:DNA (cytosine-5)-methyltransferase 1